MLGTTIMDIQLGTITHADNDSSIHMADSITEDQHKSLLASIADLHHFENNKRLFEIAFQNKNEFVDTLNRDVKLMILSSLSISGDKKTYYKNHLNFNRLFLNYLSSIKTFIDHNETNIKRRYGKNSAETTEFTKITNYYFDNSFAYRFFSKLRNYAQHCGMPLQEFSISVTRTQENGYVGSSELGFSPKDLLENFDDWGRIVKEDLQKQVSNFPLAPLVEEMTQVLMDFWLNVNRINEKSVTAAINNIKHISGHLKKGNASVCIFTNIKDKPDGSVKNLETLTIPYDIIDDLESNGSA